MRKILFFCLVIIYSSCTLKEQDKTRGQPYFDLNSYFRSEAKRLSKVNLQIDKIVRVNGESEEKNIKINNWEKEFDSFISADINKASWRESFTIEKNDTLTAYTSSSTKIPVKKLLISYQNKKIKNIKIFITNSNNLYTSKDSLSYYPDSLYRINKTQHIKLMEEKKYIITGRFKQKIL